ncbi:MAG: SDR family NAD(P)-dependent oxidoreductase [Firmicutes bacterium]|nr:SDR family NAD(P)-dependent oxidoreductase [Bacillota bacterium]
MTIRKHRTAVVTGGSSGIGKATAELLAARGWYVYELSRSGEGGKGITHIACDLAKSEDISAAFNHIEEESGAIELLVNNAGMGVSGATELLDETEVRRMVDIDLLAPWLCCKAAIPLLRQTKGRIINVSSVAAVFAIPYQSFYTAVKAGINGLTQALALELKPFGISVTALLPGDVHTGFTAARVKDMRGNELYQGAVSRSIAVMEHDEAHGMPPQKLAERIVQLAGKYKVKPFYSCGFKYQLFLFLGKILPCALVTKILGKMYCK